ncbi:hydrolase [Streptomyces zinciresistens K42]|uniref:Hydrolase n=1 Tax=Streptomyces zinciresistens K42 TaxID=700597 RepID=G2GAI4_9ACTN|nr:HAD family hydrolase [Streptomyces zinciresistens]EGX59431.1 hydrolase [Streptomyces zinciresistens K42]
MTTTSSPGGEDLRAVLGRAEAVLLDFDGPLCDLFGGTCTAGIADEIKERARREWGRLDPPVESCADSHGILLRLADMAARRGGPGPIRLDWADAIVTRHEYAAVHRAVATPGARRLVDALRSAGKTLLVVTNNAEGPVREYLERRDLLGHFTAVYGRDPHDPRLMKPHPGVVGRALAALGGTAPSRTLLIGDQLTDLAAARAAGVPFLGFTRHPERAERMRRLGARGVVGSYPPVLRELSAQRVG